MRSGSNLSEEATVPQALDFKKIAEEIDIFAVAQYLNLTVVKDRAACPICKADRALQFFPATNSFQCHAAGETHKTDCISLYAHIMNVGMYQAAKRLHERFGGQEPAAGKIAHETSALSTSTRVKRSAQFDPDSYLAKLSYNDEVAALGISEEDASRLGIGAINNGLHKGRIVFAIRNPDGSLSGFIGVAGSDIKVPKQWIGSNVTPFKRRA